MNYSSKLELFIVLVFIL